MVSVAWSRLRRDELWSLSATHAFISILFLIAAPSAAQTRDEPATTTLTMAPLAAGDLVGADWLGSHDGRPAPALNFDGPWQGRGAMVTEQRLAQQVLRSFWPEPVADPKAGAILDGVAYYLQTRAVEKVFDAFYLRTAHSAESRPYFGGHVRWSFPTLRLSRHAVAARDRYGAVFESLDRWLGTPTMRTALFEVSQLPVERLTADGIVSTISNASGQDLSWAFDAAAADVNYAVDNLSANSVTVSRRGSGMFTGRAAPRVGEYQSGDALQLKVVFADGSTAWTTWDGRDQTRTFTFQGPGPIVAAYLDPDRIVAVDSNRLDNAITAPAPTNVPVRKWAARWLTWLQHTMLSYGFLA
jgi:hypothetical protein